MKAHQRHLTTHARRDAKKKKIEALKLGISEMEEEKKKKESAVNLPALAQYRKKEEEYHVRVQELEEATVSRKEARE